MCLYFDIFTVFVSLITMCCCEGVRRTSPHNMIFLSLFTIGEAITVAYGTLNSEADIVMIAVGLTAVVVIALTIFAFQTKWDFTMMGGTLFAALFIFVIVGFIMSFTAVGRSRTGELVMCSIGVLIFSAYLICKSFTITVFCVVNYYRTLKIFFRILGIELQNFCTI